MLRKVAGMIWGERQADGSVKKVQHMRDIEPCIRPGLSLVFIPGEKNKFAGVTDSIQLPKGSMVWSMHNPHVSEGDEVIASASEVDKGWQLDQVVVLEPPVPCRGAQGLWALSADVLELVRERWRATSSIRSRIQPQNPTPEAEKVPKTPT